MDKEEWQNKGAGHRQRLRDRFLECGLDGFTDAEILELLLSFGTPRSDCKQAAKEALSSFGSLSAVLEESPSRLQQIKGIGPKNGFAIHFIQCVASRYLKDRLQGKRYLHGSVEVLEYLTHAMRGLKKEVFTSIYLDSSHAIITSEVLSEGTINVNTIYPRELIKAALQKNAAAIIIAHNHPSGSITPSSQDVQLTKTLFLLGSMMQISLLDHIIIGNGSYSFADNGVMKEISSECYASLRALQTM